MKYKIVALDTDFHEFVTLVDGLTLEEAEAINSKYSSGTMIELDAGVEQIIKVENMVDELNNIGCQSFNVNIEELQGIKELIQSE